MLRDNIDNNLVKSALSLFVFLSVMCLCLSLLVVPNCFIIICIILFYKGWLYTVDRDLDSFQSIPLVSLVF